MTQTRISPLRHYIWLSVLAAGIAVSTGMYLYLRGLDAQSVRVEMARRSQIKLDAIRSIFKQYIDTTMVIDVFIQDEITAYGHVEEGEARSFAHALLATHPDGLAAIAIIPPPGTGEVQYIRRDGTGRPDPPIDRKRLHQIAPEMLDIQLVRDHKRHWMTRLSVSMKTGRGASYAISDWHTTALIDNAITGTPGASLDSEFGLIKNDQFTRIYRYRQRLLKTEKVAGEEDMTWRGGFSLNGTNFEVRTRATPAAMQRLVSADPAWALLLGMMLSLLLTYLAYNRGRYGERLRRDVAWHVQGIKDEEKKLASIIDHANETILLMDEQGNILRANPAASDLFGYTPEEWNGLSVHALAPEELREPHTQWFIEGMADRRHDIMGKVRALRARRKDGSVFPCEVTANGFTVDGMRRISVILRDLTARKQAEAELARLKVAVEQTPEGIFITDHEGRIVYANPSVADMSGIGLGQLIGRLAVDIRGGRKDDTVYNDMFSCLNQGRPWHGDVEFVRPDGAYRVIKRSIAPMMEDGAVRYHVCVDTDVTEQRQAQSRMEHTQRLESLGVLAGGIAHDFNNILTAIMGNAALGRMKLDDAHPAMAHLARIEESSQRAAELCKQMLAYSGRGQFAVKPMNLSDMVEKITKLLQVSIAKNAVLKFHLAENLPAVEADAAQLQQVIMNLVINASEAIGEKSGVISLSTGMMQADAIYLKEAYTAEDAGAGHYVFLEVADTGCGMDKMTRRKLFDPFFTTKFTGRGLGMSAVLGIVRGHHGAIRVYSESGAGTTFKMLLPASEAKLDGQTENTALNGWSGVGVVLIVDDEETIRETAAMMLEGMGFDTLTAEDGMRGVEVYRAHQDRIVAVLLDMTMPKLDGKGCFRELRRINRNVRVILSSGYNEQDATNRFAGQGLTGFIQKPYAPEALRAKMKETLVKGR